MAHVTLTKQRLSLVLAPLLLLPLADFLAVAPMGSRIPLLFAPLVVLPALLAALFIIMNLSALLFRPFRSKMLPLVLLSALYLGSVVAGMRTGRSIRMEAFTRLDKRSQPLVKAIKDYEHDKGAPPMSLEALIPEYLRMVPSTGMSGYPAYRYLSGESARHFAGNPWVLIVDTPRSALNWDQFMYFPQQNYPGSGYGGVLRRVGDWAYLNE